MTPAELEQILTRVVMPLPEEALNTTLEELDVDSLARAQMVTVIANETNRSL